MLSHEKLTQLINVRLKEMNISATEASKRAVGNNELVRNITKRGHKPTIENLATLLDVLDCDLIPVVRSNTVPEEDESTLEIPYIGEVAAGGGDTPGDGRLYYPQADDQKVSAPHYVKEEEARRYGGLVATTISGTSMYPAYYDGDTVYFYPEDPLRFQPEQLIGRDCAVCIDGTKKDQEDNTLYIKRLRRGDSGKKGEWNLESLNPVFPTIINTHLHHASPIRYIKRKV